VIFVVSLGHDAIAVSWVATFGEAARLLVCPSRILADLAAQWSDELVPRTRLRSGMVGKSDSHMGSTVSEPGAPAIFRDGPPSPESFTRVTLRPIASPLPLAFGALAVATVVVAGSQLGWIPTSETTSVALILLAAVAPAQLLTSILSYLARDGVAGTGMGTLAGTWAALGLILLMSEPGSTGHAPGLLLLVAAVVMLIPAAGAALGKFVPAAVLTMTAIRFAVTGVWEFTGSNDWKVASGIVGLILGALAIYAAAAVGLEDAAKRRVLPVGRHGKGAEAAAGDIRDQIAGIVHEPGVRQQL
jgi:succinate-acetate transporter protein